MEDSLSLQWDAAYVADLSNVTQSNTCPMGPSAAGLATSQHCAITYSDFSTQHL